MSNLNNISTEELYLYNLIIKLNLPGSNLKNAQYEMERLWVELNVKELTLKSKNRSNITKIVKKANETLELKMQNKQYRNMVPNNYVTYGIESCFITFTLLQDFHDKMGYNNLAIFISNQILKRAFLSNLSVLKEKYNEISYRKFKELVFNIEYENDEEIQIQQLNLGTFFIDLYTNLPTPLYFRTFTQGNFEDGRDDAVSILKANEEYYNQLKSTTIFIPESLPMLCSPNIWNDQEHGGFLLNKDLQEDLISGSSFHNHRMINRGELFKAINKLNSVPFRVNFELLDFLYSDGNIILKNYLENSKNETDRNLKFKTLKLAEIFKIFKFPFYINCSADWRGRIYSRSTYLNYQGNELSNSLLEFYNGKPLDLIGKKYLFIYGANTYNDNGMAKRSFNDRIKWVEDNFYKIISLDIDFLLEAESPILFASFALNLKKYHQNPNCNIHLPVFLDATCSGIQHLSGMILDLETGYHVNLISQTNDSQVNDIYGALVNPINVEINAYGKLHKDFKELQYVKLSRKDVKPPIMTKVYNVSITGVFEQLATNFKKVPVKFYLIKEDKWVDANDYLAPSRDGFIQLNRLQVYAIAQIIYDQIFTQLPSLKPIFNYLQSIVKLCLKFNVPLTWITPSGISITQEYLASTPKKVSISLGKKTRSAVLRISTGKVNNRKQAQAIIPNIVHSLDASHLMNILNNSSYFDISNILSVHDCFGAHPNEFENLTDLVLIEFVKLYTDFGFLTKFHERILQSFRDHHIIINQDENGENYILLKKVKFKIPNLPKKGNLDLNKTLESKHFLT